MSTLIDQLRERVKKSRESRYSIARATGVNQSVLSRLMAGQKSLSVQNAERIARHFGFEIALKRRRKAAARKPAKSQTSG